jgi:hypothetical protein
MMSDENLNVNPQVTDEVTAEENEGHHIEGEVKPPSKWEQSAREGGWVPLEEWQGDPDDWTDAKEFVKRGELFHKISNQSSEIKELKKAISGLMEHHHKVKETEFKRALDYLKQQKKVALEEGDADKLLAVDEAIDTLKEEQQQAKVEVQEEKKSGPTPTFVGWVKSNPWYIKDPELRAFADDVGVGIFQRNQGQITEEDLYKQVKARVMKAYPEKFKGQGTKSPNVEGGNTQTRSSKADNFSLSEDEKRVMNTFVRQGVMTKEEYISELKRVKGVA